ncbi:hypothetical protein ACM46_02965 [Chryseobacterium angstadtii]|uniref:Uncharacterized protein n=1 Tax=Chryseobacterium angstadtii TaxID=558151 RepID=A0A0J7IKR9_9FLAO|nr:hypothetical protein ACM46_02965 [Chryseobacterium angstadtii]
MKRQSPSEKTVVNNDRIIYLFFKAEKDPSANPKIALQNTQITGGKLKRANIFQRKEIQKGDLIITLEESGGKEVAKRLVKDPFNPELEVFEKEGISKRKISLQSAEFSARFSYSENIQMVKVEKATDDGLQVLFTQKL